MHATTQIQELRQLIADARSAGQSIGCVPTMGALHAGHLSLIERASQETDFVVVTIFVNPTQFAPHEDFNKYPRPLERDLELCESGGAALVFHPDVSAMHGKQPQITLRVGELASHWEGASRPEHFHGVATVVAKLFNLVQPDRAFFGQKDYQQLAVIRALTTDLNFPIEIVGCPTIRDEDGLALSSRNVYLSPTEREAALSLNHALTLARELVDAGDLTLAEIRAQMREVLESRDLVKLDYATIADPTTLSELERYQRRMVALIAARVGNTRLIDNLELESARD